MITVTAVEFQRNFGEFQKRAKEEPVEITRHGRRDLVLMSAAHYERLKGASMSVGQLIDVAFNAAMTKQSSLHAEWIAASIKVGGRLPQSMLMGSVQALGQLDMVLRCMEDEAIPHVAARTNPPGFHHQHKMSGQWVTEAYEIVRLQKERRIWPNSADFASLHDELRLLRVPMEKHEIAATAKQRKSDIPIPLKAVPPRAGDVLHEYRHADPQRAMILPGGTSGRGSLMWMVTDITTNQSRWLERRTLSEKLLALWSN